MKSFLLLFSIVVLASCKEDIIRQKEIKSEYSIYDSHVHIMSPQLISYWKSLGIPFSKSEAHYSNIDTILSLNAADQIDLIGMGYVYGNPEYYSGNDHREKMMAENDYLITTAQDYPNIVTPYFSVDPLKDYALAEIERCHQLSPHSGLKLHFSSSQVYLTEPDHLHKVKQIFKAAASHKLSILLHFDNWHPKFGRADITLLADSILSDVPAISLRIAHFGTSGGFNSKTKDFISAYIDLKNQNRIAERHNIYFDISAVALDKDSEGVSQLSIEDFSILKSYIDTIGIEHIVFGTDYPLYTSNQYIQILKDKVGLSQQDINLIIKKKH